MIDFLRGIEEFQEIYFWKNIEDTPYKESNDQKHI